MSSEALQGCPPCSFHISCSAFLSLLNLIYHLPQPKPRLLQDVFPGVSACPMGLPTYDELLAFEMPTLGHLYLLPETVTLSCFLPCSPLPLPWHTADLSLWKGYRVLSWVSYATSPLEVTVLLPITPAARLGPLCFGSYSPAHSSTGTSPLLPFADCFTLYTSSP